MNGTVSHRDLATRFGITPSNVSRIVAGHTWTHVTEPQVDGAI